jgi:hypothetical protein
MKNPCDYVREQEMDVNEILFRRPVKSFKVREKQYASRYNKKYSGGLFFL